MGNKPTVIVVIDPKTGHRTYEVEGMPGVSCEDITQALMQANKVVEHEYTNEYVDQEFIPNTIDTM